MLPIFWLSILHNWITYTGKKTYSYRNGNFIFKHPLIPVSSINPWSKARVIKPASKLVPVVTPIRLLHSPSMLAVGQHGVRYAF